MESLRIRYTQEFLCQPVKFFEECGLALGEAVKWLSLPKGALKNWTYADKRDEFATVGKH